jgi:CheY-like chemotaxis protein
MKKILIIEDEMSYVKLLRRQLTLGGYEVMEATDGKQGLAMATQHHPDLILLDVRMPQMSGIAVLNELRKDPYGKKAKVILLTNLEPDDKTVREVVQNQPSFYLVKSDTELEELMKKVKALIQSDE